MSKTKINQVEQLLGRTLVSVVIDYNELHFVDSEGRSFKLYHDQD